MVCVCLATEQRDPVRNTCPVDNQTLLSMDDRTRRRIIAGFEHLHLKTLLFSSSMNRVEVLDINTPQNQTRWIVGTPPDVNKNSSYYSEHVQIRYIKCSDKVLQKLNPRMHSHPYPAEEYYLVLAGQLKMMIDNEELVLKEMQLVKVPPDIPHQVVGYSNCATFMVIRAPKPTATTEKSCE